MENKLTKEQQIAIDVHMAYFHPMELNFSKEIQEHHMLEALKVFSSAYGCNGELGSEITTELRGMWFARNKQKMYNFLDKYIEL